MIARRQLLFLALVTLALIAIVKMLQLALTPEMWEAIAVGVERASGNVVVRALAALLVLAAVPIVAGWVSVLLGRLAARRARRRSEAVVLRYLVETYRPRPSDDTSSLLDDTPRGPLPESFRAPCGEPLRFPPTNDRGPRAA